MATFFVLSEVLLKSVNTVYISPLKVIIFLHLLLRDRDHISESKSANPDVESHRLAGTGSMLRKASPLQIGTTLFAFPQLVIRVLHIPKAFFTLKAHKSFCTESMAAVFASIVIFAGRLILRFS